MPPSRRGPRSQSASTIFVDRVDPKRIFEQAALSIPREGCMLRSWYGVGGQGKTALARELFRISSGEVEPSYAHLRRAMVDLHERSLTDPDRLLVWIRNAFSRAGVTFPAFDLAFAIMWEKTRGEEALPKFENAWLFRTGEALTESLPDAVTFTRELMETSAETIPVLGFLLKKGSQWALDRGKQAWLERTRPQLQAFYRDGLLIEDHEMSDLMPWMLAQDLNQHLAKRPRDRFVLFVDEYERVIDGAGTGARWRENRFDTHMRRFVSETDGLLAIFFSRERLPWEEEQDWRDDLKDNQHLLGGLSDGDADDWLRQLPVEDAAIREAMIAGARETDEPISAVYPLMLDLQVEHWKNLGERSQPEDFLVAESGFEARRRELVQRLLRDYDDPIQELISRLALAHRFDRATVEYIVRTFNVPVSFALFDRLADLSIISIGEDGWLSTHRVIADAIVYSEKVEVISATRDALLAHFEERSQPERAVDVTTKTLNCFTEAARLRQQKGSEGYVAWLDKTEKTICAAHQPMFLEELWRNAVAVAQQAFGDLHYDVAESYNNLAYCLQVQGRPEDAEALYRKSLRIWESTLGEGSLQVATSYNNLAGCLEAQGRFADAEPLCRRGLEIRQAALGEMHPDVGSSYNNLAACVLAQGRFADAEPLCRKGLEIRERALGDAHPYVGTSYNNLASCLDALGRFADAEPLFRKGLEIWEQALGEAHPDVGLCYNNLASCLKGLGRPRDAEPLCRKGLEIRQAALGEIHSDVGSSFNNLAGCLLAQGSPDDAEPLYRKSLEIWQVTLGEQHPHVGLSYNNLASCLHAQGRFAGAETLCRKGLEIQKAALGEMHPDVGSSYNTLASCLKELGRLGDAEALCRRGLAIRQTALREMHPDVGVSYNNIGSCLLISTRN